MNSGFPDLVLELGDDFLIVVVLNFRAHKKCFGACKTWSLRALCASKFSLFFVFVKGGGLVPSLQWAHHNFLVFGLGGGPMLSLHLALITEIIGTLTIIGSVERRSKYVKIIRFCPLTILWDMSN